MLLASVLPRLEWTPRRALEVVGFYLQRNYAAYLAHRKRQIQRIEDFL